MQWLHSGRMCLWRWGHWILCPSRTNNKPNRVRGSLSHMAGWTLNTIVHTLYNCYIAFWRLWILGVQCDIRGVPHTGLCQQGLLGPQWTWWPHAGYLHHMHRGCGDLCRLGDGVSSASGLQWGRTNLGHEILQRNGEMESNGWGWRYRSMETG